jgi:hypothetical protein
MHLFPRTLLSERNRERRMMVYMDFGHALEQRFVISAIWDNPIYIKDPLPGALIMSHSLVIVKPPPF